MQSTSFQNKSFLVIGGSHGIGLGIVQRLSSSGARTLVASRTVGQLEGLANVAHIPLNVVEGSLTSEVIPEVLDGFVYCPGSINLGPFRSLSVDALRADFELNVVGAVRCFQAALNALKRSSQASAVFFSTVAVAQGLPMHSSIAAAKGAIEALVRTWAAELSPSIRVNAIAPALTDTPLAERFLSTDEKRQSMAARYPLGRVGTVDDMAGAAMFALSNDSSWMTGQVMNIDGGMSSIRK